MAADGKVKISRQVLEGPSRWLRRPRRSAPGDTRGEGEELGSVVSAEQRAELTRSQHFTPLHFRLRHENKPTKQKKTNRSVTYPLVSPRWRESALQVISESTPHVFIASDSNVTAGLHRMCVSSGAAALPERSVHSCTLSSAALRIFSPDGWSRDGAEMRRTRSRCV